jgi:predicted MFS family arabinose efflux permease
LGAESNLAIEKDSVTQEQGRPIGYFQLIRSNVDFRYLWSGQIVSLFGDWFNLIGAAALIARLTESGLAVGGLFVIRMLAQFVGTQAGGVAADRYNRKRLLILTDITRAIVAFGFLLVRGPEQVWLLYALSALLMAISGVFFPTRTAILADIVKKDELGSANALTSTTWSVMLAVGSALGGFAAGQWGIYQAFAVDGTTFLISAALISRVRYQHVKIDRESDLRAVLKEYTDGLRYLRREIDILFITLHKAALGLLIAGGAINIVMVQISESIFVIGEGGATSLGIMWAVIGLGTGIGPILGRLITHDRDRAIRLILPPMYLLAALGLIVAAQLTSYGIVLVGMFLRTFAIGAIWVFTTQLLYQLVPENYQGRVFAVEIAFFTLGSATSGAVGGWLLDTTPIGLSGIMLVMAASALIPAVLWSIWIRISSPSRTRTVPALEGEEWRPLE